MVVRTTENIRRTWKTVNPHTGGRRVLYNPASKETSLHLRLPFYTYMRRSHFAKSKDRDKQRCVKIWVGCAPKDYREPSPVSLNNNKCGTVRTALLLN